MTLFAFGAELSFVPIVFLVTGDAGRRQFGAIEIARMAGIALDRCVRAPQRVPGILVVVEVNRRPLAFAMAALARDPVTSRMNVLDLMAIHACRPDPAIAFAAVAGETGNGTVGLAEREFGCTVVERLGVLPIGLSMTLVARLPQAPLVRIGRLVTIDATSRRITEFCGRCVATPTRHRFVRALQGKIRGRVIEGFPVELNDIAIAPDVVDMAMAAVLLRRIEPASMQSLTRRAIRSDVLVTGKAQVRL